MRNLSRLHLRGQHRHRPLPVTDLKSGMKHPCTRLASLGEKCQRSGLHGGLQNGGRVKTKPILSLGVRQLCRC